MKQQPKPHHLLDPYGGDDSCSMVDIYAMGYANGAQIEMPREVGCRNENSALLLDLLRRNINFAILSGFSSLIIQLSRLGLSWPPPS